MTPDFDIDKVGNVTINRIMQFGRSGKEWRSVASRGADVEIAKLIWQSYATREDRVARRSCADDERARVYVEFLKPEDKFTDYPRAKRPATGKLPLPQTWVPTVVTETSSIEFD